MSWILSYIFKAVRAVPRGVFTHGIAVLLGAVGMYAALSTSPTNRRANLNPTQLSENQIAYDPLAGIEVFERPDSVRVDTVRVPVSISKQTPNTANENALKDVRHMKQAVGDILGGKAQTLGTPSLGYVIVPMDSGRPSFDVSGDVGTLSAYSPRTGRGIQYEYDLSDPAVKLGVTASTGVQVRPLAFQSIGAGLVAEAGRFRVVALGQKLNGQAALTTRISVQRFLTAID